MHAVARGHPGVKSPAPLKLRLTGLDSRRRRGHPGVKSPTQLKRTRPVGARGTRFESSGRQKPGSIEAICWRLLIGVILFASSGRQKPGPIEADFSGARSGSPFSLHPPTARFRTGANMTEPTPRSTARGLALLAPRNWYCF
ncbi:MAG: hypothetical protein JWM11_7371 [Planctomycetaceae bacterium]|nr:hypothetical protein [Planctomycetaceae bacterium]